MKKSKLLALLGAAVLTFGVAGVALATDLHTQQVGSTLGSFSHEDCDTWPGPTIGAGQVGVHFILTQPESDSGNLTADFTNPTTHVGATANFTSPANTLHWYIVVDGDANTVISGASTDVDGDNLNVSHTCIGAPSETPASTPTFGLETLGITECPCDTALGGAKTSGPADGAWLLVVALGVLLASIVVLTPARAKGKR